MEAPQAQQMNPYGAPLARVDDAAASESPGILDRARSVPAGHALAWYREAWRLFQIAPGAWIGIWLLFMALTAGLSLIPFLGVFVSALLTPALVAGAMLAGREAQVDGHVRVGTLFGGFATHAGSLVLIGLLQLAMWMVFGIIVGILGAVYIGFAVGPQAAASGNFFTLETMGPMILLGGLMGLLYAPITMAVWLAAGLVALNDVSALDGLRMGFSAAFRNLLPLLVFILVTIPLALLASLPLLLGWFVLGPVLLCLLYAEYRDLFALTEPAAPVTA
jgi:uncharacterized membrane protein